MLQMLFCLSECKYHFLPSNSYWIYEFEITVVDTKNKRIFDTHILCSFIENYLMELMELARFSPLWQHVWTLKEFFFPSLWIWILNSERISVGKKHTLRLYTNWLIHRNIWCIKFWVKFIIINESPWKTIQNLRQI